MTGRLSRIINRGRYLAEGKRGTPPSAGDDDHTELLALERRRHFTSAAITMCTIAALLVCLVIVSLFMEVMLSIPLNWIIGALFTLATLALVAGLAFFLREVHLSSKTILIAMSKKKDDGK
jgi:protein-S-isoprenylcysteine O-methyltransferase Ste14